LYTTRLRQMCNDMDTDKTEMAEFRRHLASLPDQPGDTVRPGMLHRPTDSVPHGTGNGSVPRYSWHSAGSPSRPFPVLKYKQWRNYNFWASGIPANIRYGP